jgi:hypothetical protein
VSAHRDESSVRAAWAKYGKSAGSRVPKAATSAEAPSGTSQARSLRMPYWISVSSLNMGMYIEMMITPTTIPTPIIISGSMTEVRVAMELSTSSS